MVQPKRVRDIDNAADRYSLLSPSRLALLCHTHIETTRRYLHLTARRSARPGQRPRDLLAGLHGHARAH